MVTDGDGVMDGGLNGNITITLQDGASLPVSWCETKAPLKYEATTNKCGSFTAQWEHAYAFTIVHEKLVY